MSDKNTDRLEHEAREALVAADLSAKMKHWNKPAPKRGPGWLRVLALLIALAGAAWWLWPHAEAPAPTPKTFSPPDIGPTETTPVAPPAPKPQPMAEKPKSNRYLALAASTYRRPDFASEVRGDTPSAGKPLDDARRSLANKRPAEALKHLMAVPAAYETDAKYLRAHALFELKKYTEAASLFDQLKNSIRYGEAAQWYEVLALLPNFEGNKSAVTTRLAAIAQDNGHTYQREAKALQLAL